MKNLLKFIVAVFITVLMILALSYVTQAQEKPKPVTVSKFDGAAKEDKKEVAPLTDAEKLAVRSAQLRKAQLLNQIADLQIRVADMEKEIPLHDRAIQQTVDAVYAKRGIKQEEYAVCADPGPGGCEKAPAGDLTLQALPKKKD